MNTSASAPGPRSAPAPAPLPEPEPGFGAEPESGSEPVSVSGPVSDPDGELGGSGSEPRYRVRAAHSGDTVTVYQAYPPAIGLPAARDGRFPAAWKRERMTWIKPSFLWMMYRCGWATKEGQETVLAVEITRTGFQWALEHACLSHYVPRLHADQADWRRSLRASPARVQWDPERDLCLRALPYRSLQLGLAGEATRRYADEWIVSVTDVTSLAHRIHAAVRQGDLDTARDLLPAEPPYPAPLKTLTRLTPDA